MASILAVFTGLGVRLAFLHLGPHDPLLQTMQEQAQRWNAPLVNEQNKLDTVIKNIETLSLAEIRNAIIQAKEFLQTLQSEQRRNLEALSRLREALSYNQHQLDELTEQRATLEELQERDVEILSYLITRDAKKGAKANFLLGVLVSFPVGVLSSLFASFFAGALLAKIRMPPE